jgi:hypothetical protein
LTFKADKSTKEVRNLIKDLEKMELNEKKVKNKSDGWKDYFNLYCKSYNEFANEKEKFIQFLDKFDKFNENISEDKSLLHNYSENAIKVCEEVRQQIKNAREAFNSNNKIFDNLLNKAKEYVEVNGSLQQTQEEYGGEKFLKAEFLKDLDDCKAKELDKVNNKLLDTAEKIAEQLHHTKHDISKYTGILSDKSIDRNVLNKNEDTPLKILKEFYNALITPNAKFPKYKGKDLLKLPKNKTFDSKVGRSMRKLTKCKFDNYFAVSQKIVAKPVEFKKTMNALDNLSSITSSTVNEYFKKYKNVNIMTEYYLVNERVEKDIEGHLKKFHGNKSELEPMKLYNLVLTHREQLKIISQSFVAVKNTLDEINKKD